jgi:hypothetical protein
MDPSLSLLGVEEKTGNLVWETLRIKTSRRMVRMLYVTVLTAVAFLATVGVILYSIMLSLKIGVVKLRDVTLRYVT